MDKHKLKVWLSTLDPLTEWDIDNIDNLEKQVVSCVKASGYLNLPLLLGSKRPDFFVSPWVWDAQQQKKQERLDNVDEEE